MIQKIWHASKSLTDGQMHERMDAQPKSNFDVGDINIMSFRITVYTWWQKKPDTFCFPLTRKVHILDCLQDTTKCFQRKFIYLVWNMNRKMTFLSNMSPKRMSKIIFWKSFHVCKTNNLTNEIKFKILELLVITIGTGRLLNAVRVH